MLGMWRDRPCQLLAMVTEERARDMGGTRRMVMVWPDDDIEHDSSSQPDYTSNQRSQSLECTGLCTDTCKEY